MDKIIIEFFEADGAHKEAVKATEARKSLLDAAAEKAKQSGLGDWAKKAAKTDLYAARKAYKSAQKKEAAAWDALLDVGMAARKHIEAKENMPTAEMTESAEAGTASEQ